MKIVGINIGCKVNEYELNAVIKSFLESNYTLGNDSNFDVAIINSCSVTKMASKKSRNMVNRLRNKNHNSVIVLMGCLANNNSIEEIDVNNLNADIIVGVTNRSKILEYVSKFLKNKKRIIDVDSFKKLRSKCLNYESLGINDYGQNTRAYVKISDGCNNFCSYCLIPFIRGKLRSRNKEEIFSEIEILLSKGYKEIVLTGVDSSSYGIDLDNYNFSDLLEEILTKFKIFRLRLSSIEVSQIDEKFISILKRFKNFANHLHLSLQSGSDKVLKDMNRKYTAKEFFEKVKLIRSARKDIAITTDVIVGYPTEGEKEFNETVDFIKKVKFKELHVFPYSKRANTKASLLKDLPSSIKKERVDVLLDLSKKLKDEYEHNFINKNVEVLIESKNQGYTSNYINVAVEGNNNEIKVIRLKKENIL